MGAYLFFVTCVGLWVAFAWAMQQRPAMLDQTWGSVRRLPFVAKPFVWLAFFPWLSGLAIWESDWRTTRARRIAVIVLAVSFIVFWSSVTFGEGTSS